jgi:hypothetical protein
MIQHVEKYVPSSQSMGIYFNGLKLSQFNSTFNAGSISPVIINCIHGKKPFNSFYYSSLRSPG